MENPHVFTTCGTSMGVLSKSGVFGSESGSLYFMIMNRLRVVRASIESSSESYSMCEYHHRSTYLSIPQIININGKLTYYFHTW